MRRRLRLAVAALACLSASAAAQDARPTPAASCIDTLPAAAFRPTLHYLVSAYHDSADARRAVRAAEIDLFTQAVAQRARRLLGGPPDSVPTAEPRLRWRDLGVSVHVEVTPAGAVSAAVRDTGDLVRAHGAGAALLLRAIDSLRRDGESFFTVDSASADTTRFRIAFASASRREDGTVTTPRFRMAFPVLVAAAPWERPVAMRGGQGPVYPSGWKLRGYQAQVLVRYVVDEHGVAQPSTMRDVMPPGRVPTGGPEREAYAAFLQSVREGLARMRFEPASVGGCAVKQLVQQPFTFRIDDK